MGFSTTSLKKPPSLQTAVFCKPGIVSEAAAGPNLLVAVALGGNAVWREKFIDRELDFTEQFTGVFLTVAAVTGALLLRHPIVINRHKQLRIPFQANEGKLT